MTDNILSKDRTGANIDLAAKDVAGVLIPRNIITNPSGNDITPLTDTQLRASAVSVSAAALPLPAGAATAAKQPALGSPGTASSDVLTVQGAAGMTALKVDGSAVTQPVSGTFWQATQPVSAAALPLPAGAATETTLSAMNTKVPALGQAAAASSCPVVLCNDGVVSGGSAFSAINTDLLTGSVSGWYDAAAFHSVAIQVIGSAGISAGAVFFEQTNDTAAAASGNVWPVEEDTTLTPTPNIAAITISASATRMFRGQVTARYVRVRISTAFTGGTVQAVAVFSQLPYQRMLNTVHQATAANLNTNVSGTVTATVTGATQLPVTPTQTFTNSAATTNATSTKTSAGTVWSVVASNINAAARFLKLYNKASAPTVGTDTPVLTIPIPAGAVVQVNGGSNGLRFGTGIAWALTAAAADTDTTAVAAGEIKVCIAYT